MRPNVREWSQSRAPGAGELPSEVRTGSGPRRDAVDVRYYVDHRRLAGGLGLVEGALNLAGMVHAHTEAAHVLGQLGKVSVWKHPQLFHVARLAPP